MYLSFLSVCISFFFNLLVQTEAIKAEISFSLERHPDELTCTLYVKQVSKVGKDLFEKVINDNKHSFIMCVYGFNALPVPEPTIRFLEACAFNILIQTTEKDVYRSSVHSSRTVSLSTAIFIYPEGCEYAKYQRSVRHRVHFFLYFANCPLANKSRFPNAVESFTSQDGYGYIRNDPVYLTETKDYSLHRKEPPRKYYGDKNVVWLKMTHVEMKTYGIFSDLIKQQCATLKQETVIKAQIGLCTPGYYFSNILEARFNITLYTYTNEIDRNHAGSVFVSNDEIRVADATESYEFINQAAIYNILHMESFYCLPTIKFHLFTVKALVSPFDWYTWTSMFLILISVLVIKIPNLTYKNIGNRMYWGLRLMFSQCSDLNSAGAMLLFWGCFILNVMYTMFVTSCLLAPKQTSPQKNSTTLLNEGYKYLCHPELLMTLASVMERDGIEISTKYLKVTKHKFTLSSGSAAKKLYGKVLRPALVHKTEVSSHLMALEAFLGNMTCFVLKPSLASFHESYRFAHPETEKMIKFTRLVSEAGVLNVFQEMYNTFLLIDFYKLTAVWHKEKELIKEDKEYIKINGAIPIILIFLALNLKAGVVLCLEILSEKVPAGVTWKWRTKTFFVQNFKKLTFKFPYPPKFNWSYSDVLQIMNVLSSVKLFKFFKQAFAKRKISCRKKFRFQGLQK